MPAPTQTTFEEIAQATAAYARPMVVEHGFRFLDIVAASALQDRIAAEIVALTGCPVADAMVGAGGFVNYRAEDGYGLDDGSPAGGRGRYVLHQWLSAKVEAYRAAQAHQVAA